MYTFYAQQNASLLEENAFKNEIIKILSENLNNVNKNICDANSKPEKFGTRKTVKKKSVTKINQKSRTEINCENHYETLYLTFSGDVDITEDTGNTSITDDEFYFVKRKRMRKRKERTPRKRLPETATQATFDKNKFTRHKHPYLNSNAIGNNDNLFQPTRNTVEKIGASYSNIVRQKPKNVVHYLRERIQ